MEGRWPAAQARQGSDSPSQPCIPHPCPRAAQRPPGREPASAQHPRPPEKGASVTGLLGTGGGGAEKTQPLGSRAATLDPPQGGGRVAPGCEHRPGRPGKVVSPGHPCSGRGHRRQEVTGRNRQPQMPRPVPPPTAAAFAPSGRGSRAVQRQQPPLPSSRSAQPPPVISINPTGRLSVSV